MVDIQPEQAGGPVPGGQAPLEVTAEPEAKKYSQPLDAQARTFASPAFTIRIQQVN